MTPRLEDIRRAQEDQRRLIYLACAIFGGSLTGGYILGWLATCHQTGTWLPLW